MAVRDVDAAAVTEPGEALYLYCLARAGAVSAIDGPGVDGEHRVTLIPFGGMVAVVSRVSVNDFCGPAAEARMRDLAWMGPRVHSHHAVVERVMRRSTVVPARFAALFSSPERLAMWLRTHRESISSALDRLTDHDEWAVKGTLDHRKAEACLSRGVVDGQRDRAVSVGTHYLQERRERAVAGARMDAWRREVCAGIAADLCGYAAEFRERELSVGTPNAAATPVVNWAFLVSRRAVDGFAARIESINAEHAGQGLTLGLSGPLPPYSFCPPLGPEPAE